MSFKIRDLGVLAYAHGFTFWFYRTEDNLEEIKAPGYFADAADMVRVSDRVTGLTSDCKAFDVVVSRNDARGVEVQVVAASPLS